MEEMLWPEAERRARSLLEGRLGALEQFVRASVAHERARAELVRAADQLAHARRDARDAGWTATELEQLTGSSPAAAGRAPRGAHKGNLGRRAKVAEMAAQGMSQREIAERLGVSKSTVARSLGASG